MKTTFRSLFGILLFLLISPGVFAQFDVSWTNMVKTSVNGNLLYKSDPSSFLDAIAESNNKLVQCEDGYAEFTIATLLVSNGTITTNDFKIIGFTPNGITVGNLYTDIQYGFYIYKTQNGFYMKIYEGLTKQYEIDWAAFGRPNSDYIYTTDVLRVERTGNAVEYYLNGQQISYDVSGTGTSWVNQTSVSISPSPAWTFSAAFQRENGGISDWKASFSAKEDCIVERDWQGAGTGSMYPTFLTDNIGIGIKTPSRKLDINGDLRIRSVTQGGSQDNVLVLDANGNVFYRDINTFTSLSGGAVGYLPRWTSSNGLGNSLLQDNTQSIFMGNPPSAPGSNIMFSLYGSNLTYPGGLGKNVGLAIDLLNNNFGGTSSGITANVQNDDWNRGIDIFTANGTNSYAGLFVAQNATTNNLGAYIYARGLNNAARAIGVYAEVGVGNNQSYAGVFTGLTANNAAYFNGNVTGGGFTTISDQKFKRNIQPVKNALDLISALSPTTYDFASTDEFPSMRFPEGLQYGFIAQEVEKVIPAIVEEGVSPDLIDTEGNLKAKGEEFKGINYTALIPVLTAGIQEQQSIIEIQNQKILMLEAEMEEIRALLQDQGRLPKTGETVPSGAMTIRPNPTIGSTFIDYRIDQQFSNAAVVVYNVSGVKVGEYAIPGTSNGVLTIDGASLPAGTYMCSLVVDGNIKEVQKFIVVKN